MNMNYFAFFPALANKATNPHADVTGYFANPPGPNGDQHAALGGQGISIISLLEEPGRGVQIPRVVHQDDVQKKWADLGGYTCSAAVLELGRVPQSHAVQPGVRGLDEDRQGLLGQPGVRRHAVPDERPAASRTSRPVKAPPRTRSMRSTADWNKTLGN